jgi:hypothetical protein
MQAKSVRKFAFGGLAVALTGVAISLWTTVGFTYSQGERVGIVRKLSERGWACKTYEGTLAMLVDPGGGTPKVWEFSVRDKAVVEQIDSLLGQRVALRYEQRKGVAAPCVGDTEYFVIGVRRVD